MGAEYRPEINLSGPALVALLQAVLARGADFRFRAAGNSMHPFIRGGDILVIAPLPARGPAPGQVIAYRQAQSGGLVVHRLVGRLGGDWLLRGDNATGKTGETVATGNLLGVVSSIERNGARRRMGLGPERQLLAWLSRSGRLVPLIQLLRCLK